MLLLFKKTKQNKRKKIKWCKGNYSQMINTHPASHWAFSIPDKHELWFYLWTNHLVNLHQLSQFCSLSAFYLPQPTHCWGKSGKLRKPWCCVSTVQQQLKHWHVINSVLVTNLKFRAARKKINAVPVKTTKWHKHVWYNLEAFPDIQIPSAPHRKWGKIKQTQNLTESLYIQIVF